MDTLIIFSAQYLIWFIAAAALVYLFISKEWKGLGLLAAASLVLAYAAGKLAGLLWYDPRPFTPDGGGIVPLISHAANNGFPSDHMLMGATIASIVFVYNRTLGLLLWALALAVGLARVAAGIHHLVDLAGAVAIAICAVAVAEYFCSRVIKF